MPGHSRSYPAALLALLAACQGGEDAERPEPNEAFSGGKTTVFETGADAFSQPLPELSGEHEDEFFVGNAIFNRAWISAGGSVAQFDGLGPLYNATNCSACHFKDGRGRPPLNAEEPFIGLLLRLSVPGEAEHGAPRPEPTYGGQLQGKAISKVRAEGREEVTYEEIPGAFPDGETYTLLSPTYRVVDLADGPLAEDTMISPRVAPAVFGLGLLEAIEEATLLEHADPEDEDGDGISGRPNRVYDLRRDATVIGRFGWKANQPTLEQQTFSAFNGDLGITSSFLPKDDCSAVQTDCVMSPSGGDPELEDPLLASTVSYGHYLAVPARRHWDDPIVLRGKKTFNAIGCAACHLPKLTTGELPDFPELSHQTIRPYTDLLLHDMGEGLADGRPDFLATGSEWRTPPLWGIGLVHAVNRHTRFLHDGRARSLLEAVLWHDGEARASRDEFTELPKADRDALITFLESL